MKSWPGWVHKGEGSTALLFQRFQGDHTIRVDIVPRPEGAPDGFPTQSLVRIKSTGERLVIMSTVLPSTARGEWVQVCQAMGRQTMGRNRIFNIKALEPAAPEQRSGVADRRKP